MSLVEHRLDPSVENIIDSIVVVIVVIVRRIHVWGGTSTSRATNTRTTGVRDVSAFIIYVPAVDIAGVPVTFGVSKRCAGGRDTACPAYRWSQGEVPLYRVYRKVTATYRMHPRS